jgi:hypothetical protein
MDKENLKIEIGATVSYWDQANPIREGIITQIIKKENNNCFLLFGGKTSMEPINEEIVIIYPDIWHKSIVPSNGIKENEYAGHQLVNKPILTQNEVNKLIVEYERMQPILKAQREQTQQEKQLEKEKQKEQYKKEYPYLIQISNSKLSSYALGSKNLKIELQKAFPGINFSVKSESYSMGCSIDVRYTDGPNVEDVRKIADKYQEGSFDGMNDLYSYSDQVFTDVFGGAKYVYCQKEESNEGV